MGWVAAIVSVISALLQLELFVLPPGILVTASGMSEYPWSPTTRLPKLDAYVPSDYTSVILAVVGITSLMN